MAFANHTRIKNALQFERDVFGLFLPIYEQKLKNFEKKYKMKSEDFFEKFNKGELGDNEEWFDWLFDYKAWKHLKEIVGE